MGRPSIYSEDERRARKKAYAKAHHAAYYAANKEQLKAYSKQWRADHKEQVAAKDREYAARNREQIRANERARRARDKETRNAERRAYYAANRDRLKASVKAWRNQNKEAVNARAKAARAADAYKAKAIARTVAWVRANRERAWEHHNRRRAKKRGAQGSHTLAEWEALKDLCGHRCACCGEVKKLTRDHIVPLNCGGSDYIENIQPLCKSCNSSKRDRHATNYLASATARV